MLFRSSKQAATQHVAAMKESIGLTESQVHVILATISSLSIVNEGMWDSVKSAVKGAVGKGVAAAQTMGHNLTTKTTADKLKTAWEKAGSPLDSDKLYAFLQSQQIDPNVITQAFTTAKVSPPAQQPTAAAPEQPATPTQPTAAAPEQPATPTQQATPATAQQAVAKLDIKQIKKQIATMKKKQLLRLQKGIEQALQAKGISEVQGVAEGLSDGGTAVIYDNGYVKIDGKMYKAKRMNHESGMGIAIQTPSKMYFSPIQNEYEMPSVTIHRALKLGGLNPVFNEGVAEGSLNEGQYEMMLRNGQVKKFVAKDDADAKIGRAHV